MWGKDQEESGTECHQRERGRAVKCGCSEWRQRTLLSGQWTLLSGQWKVGLIQGYIEDYIVWVVGVLLKQKNTKLSMKLDIYLQLRKQKITVLKSYQVSQYLENYSPMNRHTCRVFSLPAFLGWHELHPPLIILYIWRPEEFAIDQLLTPHTSSLFPFHCLDTSDEERHRRRCSCDDKRLSLHLPVVMLGKLAQWVEGKGLEGISTLGWLTITSLPMNVTPNKYIPLQPWPLQWLPKGGEVCVETDSSAYQLQLKDLIFGNSPKTYEHKPHC